jgi:two-component system, OmpR family, sensor kinase
MCPRVTRLSARLARIARRSSVEPLALCDRTMLKRAVSNVLESAHAYSRSDEPISLSVVHDAEAKTVEIRIVDRGPGISAEDLPHVSTPFFRADPSRSRNTGGIGLGLSLTRRILEAHRGSIRIRSSPEEGTTVILTLPVPSDDDAP